MDPFATPLFTLADRRLAWIGKRQLVLAQNVANADTPGWRPRDIAPFAETLKESNVAGAMARTAPGHLAGSPDLLEGAKTVTEGGRQPDGNAVSLDQELMKVADTDTAQQVATKIYQTYVGLFRTALGAGGS
jgi:flagellar basal-body rod protein FlgB